jgi:putative endonuclease
MTSGGWVYIMTNRPNGTLYIGVTDNLPRRAWKHREGLAEGFTKRYGLKRLVYAEHHANMLAARQRERNMKHYPRAWKVRLILETNPQWEDIYEPKPHLLICAAPNLICAGSAFPLALGDVPEDDDVRPEDATQRVARGVGLGVLADRHDRDGLP